MDVQKMRAELRFASTNSGGLSAPTRFGVSIGVLKRPESRADNSDSTVSIFS